LSSLIVEKTSNLQWSGTTFSIFANVLWIIIFGKILSSPEILYGIPKLEERVSNYMNEIKINHSLWNLFTPEVKNLQDSNLKSIIHTKIEVYIYDIEYFICDTHPFRDPNLSFKDIAGELNIPISHLAYVFKYHCKVSYVEYKNTCKIKDSLVLIEKGYLNNMTLVAIAEKTGFNSYNSFFVAFKKETGLSPKDFMASKKNVLS
jgi:AraC-like DNA-binding protein